MGDLILTPDTKMYPANVSVPIFNKQQTKVLCVKSRNPVHKDDYRWGFLGGGLELGETLGDAIIREPAEESKTEKGRILVDINDVRRVHQKDEHVNAWGSYPHHHSFWLANTWKWVKWTDEEWNAYLKHPLNDSDLICPPSWLTVHSIIKRRKLFLRSHFPAFFKILGIDVAKNKHAADLIAYG